MINPISMHEVGKARQADVLRQAEIRRQAEEAREDNQKEKTSLFSRLPIFNKKEAPASEARPGRLATEQ